VQVYFFNKPYLDKQVIKTAAHYKRDCFLTLRLRNWYYCNISLPWSSQK